MHYATETAAECTRIKRLRPGSTKERPAKLRAEFFPDSRFFEGVGWTNELLSSM